MTERDLELALRALGARLEAAPTADLAGRVTEAITERDRGIPAGRRRRLRPAMMVALAVLALATTAVAAVPQLRHEVRSWFGVAGVRIEAVDALPDTVAPATIRDLRLGAPVTDRAAERLLGAPLPVSRALGPPGAILASTGSGGPIVTLVWAPRTGLPPAPLLPAVGALLTLAPARGPGDPLILAKSLPPGSRVSLVTLDVPAPDGAAWIEGPPHAVTTLDGRRETFRLAANVLLWRRGERVNRLESALDRDAAAALAEALTAGG